MDVPTAREIAKKFVRVTSQRTEDYEEGVKNPRVDWAKATGDAEDRYEDGVKKAIQRGAFGKGVTRCGTDRQKQKTIEKGVPIWGDRIMLAEDDMAAAMEPVVKVLSGITLSPAYTKGDPRNIKRVTDVTEPLHKMKIGA